MRLRPAPCACLSLLLCGWPSDGGKAANALPTREDLLRVAYVYNIAKFVEWPTSAPALVLCVTGQGALAAATDTLADEQVRGRSLIVVSLDSVPASSCDLAYVTTEPIPPTLLNSSSTLTICDAEADDLGACMIRLFEQGNRLQFDVDLAIVRRADLQISSRLLVLAAHIRDR